MVFQRPDISENAFARRFSYRTGVVDDNFRVRQGFRLRKSRPFEVSFELLAVRNVLLAAIGMKEKFLARKTALFIYFISKSELSFKLLFAYSFYVCR